MLLYVHLRTRYLSREIRKSLGRSDSQCLCRALLHNTIGLLVGPELEIRRAVSRLADMSNHPRYLEPIGNINMLTNYACLIRACGPELFKKHEPLGRLGTLERNRRLVAEL
jgi:hypothetical protein